MQEVICTAQPFCYLEGPGAQTDPDAGSVSGSGSGSGSGTQQIYTAAAPPAAPADPTKAAIWYPLGGGGQLEWDTVGLTWV